MARHPGDRLLALVDERLAATDEGHHAQRRQRDHRQEPDDEQRFVVPQHHRPEQQRHEAAHDRERQRVDELLEAGGEAQDPLGQRPGEVVVEERGVLGEQLVHADHVQVLDAAGVKAVQAVQADAPQRLREQQDAGEAEDVGQRRADGDTGVAGDSADELRDDQRRDVVDADVAQRRQQHRGHRQPPEPGQLPSVVTKCEEHRAPAPWNLARFRRSHHNPVSSCGSPPCASRGDAAASMAVRSFGSSECPRSGRPPTGGARRRSPRADRGDATVRVRAGQESQCPATASAESKRFLSADDTPHTSATLGRPEVGSDPHAPVT